ncbi:MAG: tripartite tricarboxylate transporter substrate binding protein [Alphaproteobacteria bacterium]|jgi:tripartite-type tricarboxylate transporter receptor subunit TctC|nr:tripartite tricarboxylate transporter substrate binding protein [Alphaproteobacteria bacterium]
MSHRRTLLAAALAAPFAAPFAARAQSWAPSRPVRLVVPIAAGGALDITARLLGERLTPLLGQQVVVENRAGAGGNIGAQHVAQSERDGHTIMLAAANTLAGNKWLYGNRMPIEPTRDLAPVTRVSTGTILMVVNAQRPWRTFAELIAFARANPGRVTMGSSGTGTTSHLYIETVKRAAGVDITHVPYRGGGPAIQDLVAGNIDMMFDVMPALMPHVREGRIRALAVGSAQPVNFVPGIETVPGMATLLPGSGIDAQAWYAVTAPGGTPAPILERWHALLAQVVRAPDFGARITPLGFQPVLDDSPAAFLEFWRAQEVVWRGLVETSGATAE